jgi:hypothetical protein
MVVQQQQDQSIVDDAARVYQIIDFAIQTGRVIGIFWSIMTNGVTNVKEWKNQTGQEVEVWKTDDHGNDREDHYRVAPGETVAGDMWIPWADNAAQYTRKHATLTVGGKPLAYLWQSGSKVRFNTHDEFLSGGFAVPGANGAGGERRVIVVAGDDGRPSFVFSRL